MLDGEIDHDMCDRGDERPRVYDRSCRGSGRRRVTRRKHKARVEELEYYQTISSRTILITMRTERVGRAQELTQLAKPESQIATLKGWLMVVSVNGAEL